MAVDVIAGKMGADILLLDMAEVTLIADYFVIATGETERQMRAIVQDLQETLESRHGLVPLAIEGTIGSGWVLVDYGGLVVHLMTQSQRARYQLERLWSKARTVVRLA